MSVDLSQSSRVDLDWIAAYSLILGCEISWEDVVGMTEVVIVMVIRYNDFAD